MAYDLPVDGEPNWDVKLNASIEAVKATADSASTTAAAAQPAADLDTDVTALAEDDTTPSALRTSLDSTYGNYVGAKATRTVTQSAGSGAVTVLTLDSSEEFDSGAFHDSITSPGRITVPAGHPARIYHCVGHVRFAPSATGTRVAIIRKNGATVEQVIAAPDQSGNYTFAEVTSLLSLIAGDYIEVAAYQDSGASLDILGNLSVVAVGLA